MLTADRVLAAIGVGALFTVIWPIVLMLLGTAPLQLPVAVAHVTGMAAGYGIVVLIALMSRAPALEREVGSDRLARWHSRGGRVVVVLVIAHAWAAVTAWADARGLGFAAAVWQVVRMPFLVSATVATALLVTVAVISIRAARRRLSYERWHAVHLLVYIAVALGFLHQLAGPDLVGHRLLQVCWALLYTAVFALVVQYRVITPVRNATRHRMRVTRVVHEAPGVVSVHVTGTRLDELAAEAGQFFRWRFLTPELWATAHPFSLSAPPTPTELRLTVKALGDGSSRLQRLEAGTWVVAEGPYGAMTAARRTRAHVLLIAGGVGITPMRALFEAIPSVPGQDVLLLYRARSWSDVIHKRELDAIAHARGARICYLVGDGMPRFSAAMLSEYAAPLRERDIYLCGPAAMSAAVRGALAAAGVPDQQLHEERFAF